MGLRLGGAATRASVVGRGRWAVASEDLAGLQCPASVHDSALLRMLR